MGSQLLLMADPADSLLKRPNMSNKQLVGAFIAWQLLYSNFFSLH